MGEEFEKKYPKISKLTRPLRSENDKPDLTSVQTYLIGELSSYSLRTLVFYFDYIKESKDKNINLIYEINKNVIAQKGFDNMDQLEQML